jgi:hypothetical protein
VVQLVADMDLLTVQVICTSLYQVHHLHRTQECHVQAVIKQMDKVKEIMACFQEAAALQG